MPDKPEWKPIPKPGEPPKLTLVWVWDDEYKRPVLANQKLAPVTRSWGWFAPDGRLITRATHWQHLTVPEAPSA